MRRLCSLAAGGVLVGATVGVVEVLVREGRASAVAQREWMEREMPTALEVPLLRLGF